MSKIPPHAKCVFKGIIFDIYQWEQKMFDGTIRTFEIAKRPDTVIVIPLDGDKVFYAKQEQPNHAPFLSLFGGRADMGEVPLDVAKRELLEEAGLVSDDWQQLRYYKAPSKVEWNIYYFIAKNCRKGAAQNLDGGEKIEICQTTLDDFLANIITAENFAETELRQEIYSALSPAALAKLKQDILGGQ